MAQAFYNQIFFLAAFEADRRKFFSLDVDVGAVGGRTHTIHPDLGGKKSKIMTSQE